MAPMTDIRFPIGKPTYPATVTRQDLQSAIDALAVMPSELRKVVSGLSDEQLDTPYRQDGWTVRQVVHHVADSHMNSYIRFRKALTEKSPDISAYDEKAWAELSDSRHCDIETSLMLIDALHRRLTMLLRSVEDGEWTRTFVHPERGEVRIDHTALLYAWHGRHHIAHIQNLKTRMHW